MAPAYFENIEPELNDTDLLTYHTIPTVRPTIRADRCTKDGHVDLRSRDWKFLGSNRNQGTNYVCVFSSFLDLGECQSAKMMNKKSRLSFVCVQGRPGA